MAAALLLLRRESFFVVGQIIGPESSRSGEHNRLLQFDAAGCDYSSVCSHLNDMNGRKFFRSVFVGVDVVWRGERPLTLLLT